MTLSKTFLDGIQPLIDDLIAKAAIQDKEHKAGGPARRWTAHHKFHMIEPQEAADAAASNFIAYLASYLPPHWNLTTKAHVRSNILHWSTGLPNASKYQYNIFITTNSLYHFIAKCFALSTLSWKSHKTPIATPSAYWMTGFETPNKTLRAFEDSLNTLDPDQDTQKTALIARYRVNSFNQVQGHSPADAYAQYLLGQHKTPYPSRAKKGPAPNPTILTEKYGRDIEKSFAYLHFQPMTKPFFKKASNPFRSIAGAVLNQAVTYRNYAQWQKTMQTLHSWENYIAIAPKLPRTSGRWTFILNQGMELGPGAHAFEDVIHLGTLIGLLEKSLGFQIAQFTHETTLPEKLKQAYADWETKTSLPHLYL